MFKKIMFKCVVFIMIFSIVIPFSVAFAEEVKTTLNVVQRDGETKYFDDGQGYLTKNIVDSDSEKGEVTIELKVTNTKQDDIKVQDSEIYLMVSENLSADPQKLKEYATYIEALAKNLYIKNPGAKIGIIGIKGTVYDAVLDENNVMNWGPNNEGEVDGTEDNAEIAVNLTDDLKELIDGLYNMNPSHTMYNINLQAAIRLANKSYSGNSKKILISLYDEVPNIAIGVKAFVHYAGKDDEFKTAEEGLTDKYSKVSEATRNEILTLKDSDVDFILLRPDDTSYDATWYDAEEEVGEKTCDFDGSPYVIAMYGTLENPTYGKMYSLNNATLQQIITENIYNDLMQTFEKNKNLMNSIKIVDYFPDDIINNFDFSIVEGPSKGTITNKISESKNIEWLIDSLEYNETAILKYKLKAKNMQNVSAIVNKIIPTNEKVDVTYKDKDNNEHTSTLTDSPKVQFVTTIIDNVAVTVLPKAGKSCALLIGMIVSVVSVIILIIKLRDVKDV